MAEDKEKEKKTEQPRPHRLARALAVVAAVMAVAAWCVFFFDGPTALVLGIVAAVAAVAGLRSGRGCLRDVAVTALIAAGVLIVVYGVFAWGLPYFIGKI